MDFIDLSPAERDDLLRQAEGHFLDFKSARIQPAKLTQAASAFANADGGELYIGIEDARARGNRWSGFNTEEDANQHVELLTRLFPPGDTFSYAFLRAQGEVGIVLRVESFKNKFVWPDSAGDHYSRRGAQNIRLNRDQLRQLEYSKGLVSFEDEKLDGDDSVLVDSPVLVGFMEQIIPRAEPAKWLRKQRLVVDDRVTVAGDVLYAEEPQVFLPKAAIKIYRYQTSDQASRESLEGQPLTIEGCAYQQIKEAVAEVVRIVEKLPVMRDSGFEAIKYPDTAIHEIVTNAVIHRDYSLNDEINNTTARKITFIGSENTVKRIFR
jgi:ATP-dependent DNA helicase RecG